MGTLVQFHVFCMVYTTLIFDTCRTADSVCPNRQSLIVDGNVVFYNDTVCCDNYELRAGQCVECEPGSFRPDDLKPEQCIPCKEGTYGKKCAFTCTCRSNQSCNSITGCVLEHDAKDDHRPLNDTWKQVSYGVAIGVVLIVICISICIIVVKKRNRISKAEINIPSVESLNMSLSNLASGAIALDPIGNCYDMYEEINESAIDAIQCQSDHDDSDSKEGSQIKPTEDAEGYLNPYHLFVHSPQARQYSTLKLLRTAQNN